MNYINYIELMEVENTNLCILNNQMQTTYLVHIFMLQKEMKVLRTVTEWLLKVYFFDFIMANYLQLMTLSMHFFEL